MKSRNSRISPFAKPVKESEISEFFPGAVIRIVLRNNGVYVNTHKWREDPKMVWKFKPLFEIFDDMEKVAFEATQEAMRLNTEFEIQQNTNPIHRAYLAEAFDIDVERVNMAGIEANKLMRMARIFYQNNEQEIEWVRLRQGG